MKLSDFYYDLPRELIAQTPVAQRDQSRLLVYHMNDGRIVDTRFHEIGTYLQPGDCLILNNSKVIPARLLGEKEGTGAAAEILLLENRGEDVWETLVRPGKKLRPGAVVSVGEGRLRCEILDVLEGGNRLVKLHYTGNIYEVLDALGQMPLPPYITEKLADKNRYQTVYAEHDGSAAAPTAGLHFTPELLSALRGKGVGIGYVTLHIGLGTFRPVKVNNITEHHMHTEHYILPEETAALVRDTKARGGRVIAVGTTSCRTLEGSYQKHRAIQADCGETDIFIYPGYAFQVIDGLITNFHLPESTLLMLVSALAGRENMLRAYQHAIEERYRFFSFGDAMLIL